MIYLKKKLKWTGKYPELSLFSETITCQRTFLKSRLIFSLSKIDSDVGHYQHPVVQGLLPGWGASYTGHWSALFKN